MIYNGYTITKTSLGFYTATNGTKFKMSLTFNSIITNIDK